MRFTATGAPTYELHERPKPVARDFGYVRIEIGAVDRKLDPRRARARLGDVYRPLLASGDLLLRIDRAPVMPSDWMVEERHDFTVRAGGRMVHGWHGLLADPPPAAIEAGLRLYHLGRLVGPPEWFGHPGPAVHPALNRLIGEVELPHVTVTLNKSDVERGSPEWLAVEQRMHAPAPVVRKLTREEAAMASPQALRTAEQVRRILARALYLLESGKLFESELGSGAGSGGGQLTLEGYAERAETDAGDDGAGEQGAGEEVPTEAAVEPADTRWRAGGPACPDGWARARSPRRRRRGRHPRARPAAAQRHGRRGRHAEGGHQLALPALRGAQGGPLVPARDSPA
jgi:hypothetical protein